MRYVAECITYRIGNCSMEFVRRPLAGTLPSEGFIGFVERMEDGRRVKAAVGRWRDGKWDNGKGRDLTFEPTHWTDLKGKP